MNTFKSTVPDHREWNTKHTVITLVIPLTILTMIAAIVNLEPIGKWMTDHNVNAGDLGTIVIAICSVFVAVWSVVWTRKHNRLSVKPYISIVRVVTNKDGAKCGLYIRNHGLGPAIIRNLSIAVPKKSLQIKGQGDLGKIYDKYALTSGDLGSYWLELLPKDACERVIWLEEDEEDSKVKEFESLMFDMVFRVDYQSFYGENLKTEYKMEENAEQVGAGNGASRRA